ncbi:MAG: glycosyltransferase family 39 protein, partial [Myxococcota bacterium]
MSSGASDRSSEASALTWGLLGATVCLFMIRFEPNLLEEGLILHVAQRMVHGEALYRDVASFTGPLPFELLTALFRIFGEEIAVARGAVVVLHGLACASVYAVALRSGAGTLAHAAAACVASAPILLFPLVSLFFHTTLAFHLCLIAAYPAVRATRSVAWALVAGVVIAFAALCKQTVGVVLAAGLLAAVATGAPPGRRVRQAFFVAFGGASIALITLAAYALRGDLSVLVQSIVMLPLSFDETFSTPFVNFWPPGAFSPDVNANRGLYLPSLYSLQVSVFSPPNRLMILATQLLYALPFFGLAATALGAARGRLPGPTVAHAAVLLALTTNLFPRTDWGHLVFALPPAVVQLLLVLPVPREKRRSWRPAIAAALVLALVLGSAGALWLITRTAVSPRFGPRVPQRPVTNQLRGRALATAIHYVRRHVRPGESIFVARSEPLIYFATDTRNPTPYSGVIPGMREEQETTI